MAEIAWRPTTEADLGFVFEAERAPENARFVRQWPLEEHRTALSDPDVAHWILEEAGGASPAGFVILRGLADPHLAVEFKRIVVIRKGAGLGRAAIRQVKHWAFVTHGAHRLWLEVKTFNARAHALYASEGFREEGTLRDCIRSAAGYESLIVMSILAPEYHALRSRRAAGVP